MDPVDGSNATYTIQIYKYNPKRSWLEELAGLV